MRIYRAPFFFLFTWLGLLLPAATSSQMGENEASDEEGDLLNFYPPLVHHKFGCLHDDSLDEGSKWKGSCDINLTDPLPGKPYEIYAKADWSMQCDPLKAEQQLGTLEYVEDEGWANVTTGEIEVSWAHPDSASWTCPMDERNPSGCGDFRTDTRSIQCTNKTTQSLFNCKRPNNADNRVMRFGELPALDIPQRHVCVQHPIFYDNIIDDGNRNIPPTLGRHRERWAKWGEYDFLPPQRWMHNAEHGAAIFLYHPCLDEESKCALRRLIQKWQDKIGIVEWEGDAEIDQFVESAKDTEDKFRFILTPYKNLWTPISVILWGNLYSSKCFNEAELDEFIASNYRRSFEDWPPNGAYNYLWTDITKNAESCAALPPTSPSTIVSAQSVSYATSGAIKDLAAQVEKLQQEVSDLQEAAKNKGSSAGSLCTNYIVTLFVAMFSALVTVA